jgi:hypothetical protein
MASPPVKKRLYKSFLLYPESLATSIKKKFGVAHLTDICVKCGMNYPKWGCADAVKNGTVKQ